MLVILIVEAYRSWGVYEERELVAAVEELRKTGEPVWAEDFAGKKLADDENAAVALVRAARAVNEGDEDWRSVQEFEPPLKGERLRVAKRVLEKNQNALKLIASARGKDANWRVRLSRPMISVKLPELNTLTKVRQLLNVQAMVAVKEGDDERALSAINDLLMVSQATDRMQFLITHLVAMSMRAMAMQRAQEWAQELELSEQVPAGRVKKLIDELLDEREMKESWKRGIGIERAMGVDAALYLAHLETPPPREATHPLFGNPLKPLTLRDGRYLLWHSTQMLKAADLPDYPSHQRATRPLREEVDAMYQTKPLHIVSTLLMPAYERVAQRHYTALAERRMAATALAIRLYALENGGNLPKNLDELAPKYLPDAPLDPMSDGKRIGYDPQRQILWSVGENGRDDGGSEREVKAGVKTRFALEDLVVHLSRQGAQ